MITGITHLTVIVRDHDEAIRWYTEVLGLELRSNETFGDDFRWVTVGVPGQEVAIVLHKPSDAQADAGVDGASVSKNGIMFGTSDCRADVEDLRRKGVKIGVEPKEQMWGTQAVIENLYGNTHVLVQPPGG